MQTRLYCYVDCNALLDAQVDDWATFRAPARIAVLLQHLREQLSQLLVDMFQASPEEQHEVQARALPTMDAVRKLLATDGY